MARERAHIGSYEGALAALWGTSGAATVFFVVRIWSKILRQNNLWWDDAVLTIAWMALIATNGCITYSLSCEFGVRSIPDPAIMSLMMATSMCTIAAALSKSAFCATLLRVSTDRRTAISIWGCFIIIAISNILFAFVPWMRFCGETWGIFLPGDCIPTQVGVVLGTVTIALSGITDILLAVCPWRIVSRLPLQRKEKYGMASAMSLGCLASIVAIFRMQYNWLSIDAPGVPANLMIILSVLNSVEPSITIMAQCLPVCRVLIRDIHRGGSFDKEQGRSSNVLSSQAPLAANENDDAESDPDAGHEMLQLMVGSNGQIILAPG